ncbi:MAG: deoxyribonuclease IV [Candidatus Omnitrophota bacterium]
MRFGVHVSIAGGVHQGLLRAVNLGCETAQLFLVNPRSWSSKPLADDEIERYLSARNGAAREVSPIAAHMPYLPNLAASNDEIFQKSIISLRDNLERCDALRIDYLVLHFGKGDKSQGLHRMREGILRAYGEDRRRVCLLLENTAGQGTEIGSKLPEISEFYSMIPQGISKGVCLDSCHAIASGYDISRTKGLKSLMDEFKKYLGLAELKLLHLNDSTKPLGSQVDRHAKIGEGHIGLDGFRRIFSTSPFRNLPGILETPRKCDEDDISSLMLVKSLAAQNRKS